LFFIFILPFKFRFLNFTLEPNLRQFYLFFTFSKIIATLPLNLTHPKTEQI